MSRAIVILLLLLVVVACLDFRSGHRAPADPDKLSCVRVKEVTPAGTINYLCEVRK